MTKEAADMCRRFAIQQIGYWGDAKRKGLRRLAATCRGNALWWLARAKQ